MENTNPHVERIIQSIESYAEETRNRAYDEGWEDACEYIIDALKRTLYSRRDTYHSS